MGIPQFEIDAVRQALSGLSISTNVNDNVIKQIITSVKSISNQHIIQIINKTVEIAKSFKLHESYNVSTQLTNSNVLTIQTNDWNEFKTTIEFIIGKTKQLNINKLDITQSDINNVNIQLLKIIVNLLNEQFQKNDYKMLAHSQFFNELLKLINNYSNEPSNEPIINILYNKVLILEKSNNYKKLQRLNELTESAELTDSAESTSQPTRLRNIVTHLTTGGSMDNIKFVYQHEQILIKLIKIIRGINDSSNNINIENIEQNETYYNVLLYFLQNDIIVVTDKLTILLNKYNDNINNIQLKEFMIIYCNFIKIIIILKNIKHKYSEQQQHL